MPNKFFDRNWWKDFVVAILATTVSIVLTFGTSKLIERNNQKKERKLTALKEEVSAFTDGQPGESSLTRISRSLIYSLKGILSAHLRIC